MKLRAGPCSFIAQTLWVVSRPLHHLRAPGMSRCGIELESNVLCTITDDNAQQPNATVVKYLSKLYHLAEWGGNLFHVSLL